MIEIQTKLTNCQADFQNGTHQQESESSILYFNDSQRFITH